MIRLHIDVMYNGLLSSLLYGSFLPVDRFSVKSTLAILNLNSLLNNLINVFLFFPLQDRLYSKSELNRHLCISQLFFSHISHLIYPEYKEQLLPIFSLHQNYWVVTSKSLSLTFFYPHICTTEKKRFS